MGVIFQGTPIFSEDCVLSKTIYSNFPLYRIQNSAQFGIGHMFGLDKAIKPLPCVYSRDPKACQQCHVALSGADHMYL